MRNTLEHFSRYEHKSNTSRSMNDRHWQGSYLSDGKMVSPEALSSVMVMGDVGASEEMTVGRQLSLSTVLLLWALLNK